MFEEHRDARELHKAEEVGDVVFPANEEASFPLEPRKEAFDQPSALIAAEVASILGLEFTSGPVWGNHVDVAQLESIIEAIAVIGPVPDQMLRLGLQHLEVELSIDPGRVYGVRLVYREVVY